MKTRIKYLICIIVIVMLTIVIMPKSQAVGLVIAFSNSKPNIGDTITVTVTGSGIAGKVNLDVSGNGTLSQNSVFVDNGSASVNLKVNGEGAIKVTATSADMADSTTAQKYEGATAGTVTAVSNAKKDDKTEKNNTSKKSSNANLSNLGIRPNDFSGFKPGTTTYNVTVPEDVESVEVYATAQDSGATISGTGTKTLQKGANALNVVVTAEDGTTKTYTINVTREGEDETEEEQPEENAEEVKNGLSNISIANLELSPSFDTDIYEYTVKYVGEDTSLDIQTVATDPNYTVEVLGNEDLKEGENIITILVSDNEGNNVATYQVTVNKTLVDEEALAREEEEKQKEEQRKMFIIAGGVIGLIVIIVIVIIVKRRRNRAYAEEFSGVPFAGINDDDDYYNDYGNNSNYYDDYSNDDNIKVKNDLSSEENQQNDENKINLDADENHDNIKVLENESDAKDIKPQEENLNTKIDNSKEKEEKERAKREFLRGYDSANDDYFEEEKPRRGRKKGKRFK